MSKNKRALLVILDGLGLDGDPEKSAFKKAKTPFLDHLLEEYPSARLIASGTQVGLPEGQFGNSEVGHLNIGAGRIVWQELSRINRAVENGDFFENDVLSDAFEKAKERGKIHVMGLFSDGGVHSHNEHLYALLKMARRYDLRNVYLHAFTDGRDTSPTGGLGYLHDFQKVANQLGVGKVASVVGRYFAMDRDHRWERIQKAYDLLVHGRGTQSTASDAFEQSYAQGVTDEFIEPHCCDSDPKSRIEAGDVVIFYNIRGDRARQITKALLRLETGLPFDQSDLALHYVTFTAYDETFDEHVHVAFPPQRLVHTLGEVIASHGLHQVRIAETEKYPHVTYFFNGGEEAPNEGEDRILVPSPKVATYDLQPEMSAVQVADKLCDAIRSGHYDLGVVNFANPDMVGHTGNFEAAIQAIECVDRELKKVMDEALAFDYQVLIISDHGNADCMVQTDGSPHTAHTTAPVPVILVTADNKFRTISEGILADVAPTLLTLMELPVPAEMTGKSLI